MTKTKAKTKTMTKTNTIRELFQRLVTFETLITILTIENLNHDNLSCLTIKSNTG